MTRRKNVRTRGKLSLSRFFQKFKEGDAVSVVFEESLQPRIPKSLNGRTGKVCSKKGRAYIVKIKDKNKEKEYCIMPIHLKKIKQIKEENDKK
jgi:large subunit ribosomal protein L21e